MSRQITADPSPNSPACKISKYIGNRLRDIVCIPNGLSRDPSFAEEFFWKRVAIRHKCRAIGKARLNKVTT